VTKNSKFFKETTKELQADAKKAAEDIKYHKDRLENDYKENQDKKNGDKKTKEKKKT